MKRADWNRWYEPGTGRYLQPEAMSQDPGYVVGMARSRHSVPVYSYAGNNPLGFFDADGLKASVAGSFSGYRVNDPTCSGRPGNTCLSGGFRIGACRKEGCKWKFDVYVNYDVRIGFQEGVDPSAPDETGQQSLWAHEQKHLNDINDAMDESFLDTIIATEGFATESACVGARRDAQRGMGSFIEALSKQTGHAR